MLEKTAVTLGFVPLTDCAPLVVAKETGLFAQHGLDVTLSKEPSWANIRDKLALGLFDAAQVLAGMPLANSTGIDGWRIPTITAMSLGLNGNAITVSHVLFRELEDCSGTPDAPQAWRELAAQRRRQGRPALRLAMVYPYSSHHYLLRYWLASGGVDPERDVELCVVPPPQMVERLQTGLIDGYCAGEPWNSVAVEQGIGRILLHSHQIWNNHPEKVLGVTRQWAVEHPQTHKALLKALIEACSWLAKPENRADALHILARPQYLHLSEEVLRPSLMHGANGYNVFYRYAATFPWLSHAEWFLTQMLRWGQLRHAVNVADVAAEVYCPDLYREAAQELGEPFPLCDRKPENRHAESWELQEATQTLTLGADKFCDDRDFPGSDLLAYLQGFSLHKLRVDWQDLRAANPECSS
ncbi:MAG: CmpA/NrtA family ABC transporter substrate-binding protein [Gammaproteobacteria bacterium]